MSGHTLNGAIALLVLGNFLALVSDVLIKWQGGEVPIFQFVFLRTLCTLVLILPFWRQFDHKNRFAGLKVHLLRAHLGLLGVTCMVIALTTLPLATANALFYAAPVLVMVLAVVFFGERLTRLSGLAVVSGFVGILVILQPVGITWHAITALVTALCLALGALLVRKLPKQPLMHTAFMANLLMVPAGAAMMVWEGAPLQWSMLGTAFGSALLILGYNITVLLAYRHVAANQVTSAEYTGLIWAILLGWVLFAEVPGVWFVVGATLIVGPLVLLSLSERKRVRRARPADAAQHDLEF